MLGLQSPRTENRLIGLGWPLPVAAKGFCVNRARRRRPGVVLLADLAGWCGCRFQLLEGVVSSVTDRAVWQRGAFPHLPFGQGK
jgi:hypothetical protein